MRLYTTLLSLLGVVSMATCAAACPFCTASSQTFSEEIASMDVVIIGTLAVPPPPISDDEALAFPDGEVPKAGFEVTTIIKGDKYLKSSGSLPNAKKRMVETIFFGEGKKGDEFLIMGVDPPELMWSTPLPLTKEGRKYLDSLLKLPEDTGKRLVFLQDYLEHPDEMVARDAYDEFAKAPYEDIQGIRDQLNHDQILKWVQNTDIPASRRRLYLTLLGVCGSEKDVPVLEKMLLSDNRDAKAGLDALIACYLLLRGEEGLPLIEKQYLANKDAEYADTYAAIMALRFHATETDKLPRERLKKSVRLVLNRPPLADLVIPDLARWQDWTVIDKLVELFVNADDESSWVRVPVINFLRACPLPEAKEQLKKLEKIDPAAVKRANTFFPFGPGNDTADAAVRPEKKEDAKTEETADDKAATAPALPAAAAASEADPPSPPPSIQQPEAPAGSTGALTLASATPANLLLRLGVPMLVGLALMIGIYFVMRTGPAQRPQRN